MADSQNSKQGSPSVHRLKCLITGEINKSNKNPSLANATSKGKESEPELTRKPTGFNKK